jgi:hypothetical protein
LKAQTVRNPQTLEKLQKKGFWTIIRTLTKVPKRPAPMGITTNPINYIRSKPLQPILKVKARQGFFFGNIEECAMNMKGHNQMYKNSANVQTNPGHLCALREVRAVPKAAIT